MRREERSRWAYTDGEKKPILLNEFKSIGKENGFIFEVREEKLGGLGIKCV